MVVPGLLLSSRPNWNRIGVTGTTGTRKSRRFAWHQVSPPLILDLLLAAYARDEHRPARRELRKLDDVQLRRHARTVFGSPPKARHFEVLTPVLLDRWLKETKRAELQDLTSLVASTLGTHQRREAQALSRKGELIEFLRGRNSTKTFQAHLCKAFIRAHKESVEHEVKVDGGQEWLDPAFLMTGYGHKDARVPYAHTSSAWEGLESLFRGRTSETRSGLIVIPTGGGKTATMVQWLVKHLGTRPDLRVLWIADQQELVNQAAAEFHTCGPQLPPGQQRNVRVVHSRGHRISSLADPAVSIVCTTRHSLTGKNFDAVDKKRLATYLSRPCVVVIDEAHHAVSPRYQALIKRLWSAPEKPLLVGLTATPFPSGAGMTALLRKTFVKTVVEVRTRELILNGDLAQPITHSFPTGEYVELNDSERRQIRAHDVPDSVFRRLDRESRNRFVVETWMKRQKEWGKTLVFACTIEHAENLGLEFKSHGVPTAVVHSQADVELRAALRSFRAASKPRVLVSVNMLLEGVDLPSARSAFLCRPTSSRVVLQQTIGRVLRGPKAGGDVIAHIVDLRDRWGEDVNILSPVDLPDLPAKPAEADFSGEHRLPPVVADDGETEIGEDILETIRRGMSERIRVWGQVASLTPTRLLGYFDLISLRIPVFEHTREAWEELGRAQTAAGPSSQNPMTLFEDLAPPEPLERDVRAFRDHCRSYRAVPTFIELRTTVDLRGVAQTVIDLGAVTESDKIAHLTQCYERSLARSAYPSFQAFDEAVRSEVLGLLDAVSTGATPEAIPSAPRTQRERLTPARGRGLDPILAKAVARGRELLLSEPDYEVVLADKPWLPRADWTRKPITSSWAYWSWRRTTRARDKPVIRVNRALQAHRTQVSDELLVYLVWHELCHHLLPGRGHDAEFRRLEALWPDHLVLDNELDTLHERFKIGTPPTR